MRHLPHSVDYSKPEEIIDDLENLSFDKVKQVMRDIIQDNSNLLKVTERAAIALDQYKELVSLVDGIIIDDVKYDEEFLEEKAKNSIAEIFLRLIFSMKNTSYWLMILSNLMEKYASKDKGMHNLIQILNGMSKGILAASRQLKYKHPTKRKKSFLRNLERAKEKNGGRKVEKKVPASSPVNLSEKEDDDNRNAAVQNDVETMDDDPDKSIFVNNNETLEEEEYAKSEDEEQAEDNAVSSEIDVEKSDKELEETAVVEPTMDASESDTNEGEKNATSRSLQEQQKKSEKTFGISYFKNEMFRNGVVESSKTYQTKTRNKTFPAFHRKRNSSKHRVNKNSRSSNTSRNDLDESENSHHSDSETVSKGSRRYKRKRTQSFDVNGQSETETLESAPKRRRSNSSSNKVTENGSRGRRKSGKDSFSIESETDAKSSISPEQPKKRGRRRKVDIMQQKMIQGNDYALKYACVHLSDVLEDPSMQHYADVIRMSHRKKKENTKLKEKQKKSRDKGEADENSLGKETNEAEVEWSVLDDAASDEDEKDNNNDEESGEMNSDNDEQVSESEADQGQVIEDDKDQGEELPDDEELETNNVKTKQTDERCHSPTGKDESSNHSETKQCTESSSNHPSVSSSHEESQRHPKSSSPTPSSHRVSSPEVFHTEDENEADESLRSDEEGEEEEEEGEERAPSSASTKSEGTKSEPSKYGKKGPRTPPQSPTLSTAPRGPRTPPEPIPEVSEDEEKANSSD